MRKKEIEKQQHVMRKKKNEGIHPSEAIEA